MHTTIPETALVAHESLFGNTEQVAQSVAKGLGESLNVAAADMSQATVDRNPHKARLGTGLAGACGEGLPADRRVRWSAPLWRHLSLVERA